MNITQVEAKESLLEIQKTAELTRHFLGKLGGKIQMLWGMIWMIGFAGIQFMDHKAGGLFFWGLDLIGFALTWYWTKKNNLKVKMPKNYLAFWSFMIGFVYIVFLVMAIKPDPRLLIMMMTTFFMMGYIILGLWTDRIYLLTGLVANFAAIYGFYCVPMSSYPLLMGICGGGAMFIVGLYQCRPFKS